MVFRYKVRGHNVTTIPLTLRQKSLLDESALNQIEKSFLDPRVAPLMVDDKMLKLMPRTHIVVCEYDTLRDDGVSFASKPRASAEIFSGGGAIRINPVVTPENGRIFEIREV